MKGVIWIIFAFMLTGADYARQADDQIVYAKLRMYDNGAVFLADITQDGVRSPYRLRTTCLEGCKKPVYFSENYGDTPLGLFSYYDMDNLIVSYWQAASAYKVRIFRISGDGVVKVLDEYSMAPLNIHAEGSVVMVTLAQHASDRSTDLATVKFHWVNGHFVKE